ncbi:unnamed protein product, partial [Polarella glacialis]
MLALGFGKRKKIVNEFLFGCFLVVNLLYNYLMSIFTPPGQPPEYTGTASGSNVDQELGEQPVPPKQCPRCQGLKPPRTHHCSVCKRCVLKMDHHCPWINNCVGWNNYRYFCLFMLFLAMSCLFVVIISFPIFMQAMFPNGRRRQGSPRHLGFWDAQCVALSGLMSLCILLALCLLGGFH